MSENLNPGNIDQFHSVHHVGVSVTDIDVSLAFWARLLNDPQVEPRVVEDPFIGNLLGYPGARIKVAFLDIPGGLSLELVEHLDPVERRLPSGTAYPGAVHVCLAVHDVDQAWVHALACGGSKVGQEPVEIPSGPNKGARHVYVRDPDGVTIELRQPPAPVR